MSLAAPPRNPTISIVGGVKEQTGISRAQYEILAAEYIAHAEDDGSKVSEMFKGDSSEKHKSKGWNSASTKNKRS